MADSKPKDNVRFVPIRTPMFDGPGMEALGNITRTWVLWFEQMQADDDQPQVSSSGAPGSWIEEVPAGVMNGSNMTFTLSATPVAGSLDLELNIPQVRGTDYTITGSTITYTVAPKARDAGYHKARYQF